MNEKYQQALDIIKHAHPVSSEVKDIEELYPNEIDTLHELVDMMKPLEFEELEVGMKLYDKGYNQIMTITAIHGKMVWLRCIGDLDSVAKRFELNRFYSNIWEVG